MKTLLVVLAFLALPSLAAAQEEKCKGPAQICQELLKLREQVKAKDKQVVLKDHDLRETKEAVAETAEYAEKTSEYARDKEVEAAKAQEEKKEEKDTTVRNLIYAGIIATGLRVLYSVMKAWKGFFVTEKSKAWFKVAALSVGVLAFLLTNVGLGMSWVNSLILAGGGPGAVAVHEFTKLIPILRGQKPVEPIEPEPPVEPTAPDGDSNFPGGLFG